MIVISVVILMVILLIIHILHKEFESWLSIEREDIALEREELYFKVDPHEIDNDLTTVINDAILEYFLLNIDHEKNKHYISELEQGEITSIVSKNVAKSLTPYRITRIKYIRNLNTSNDLKSFIEFRVSLAVMEKVLRYNEISGEEILKNVDTNIYDENANF